MHYLIEGYDYIRNQKTELKEVSASLCEYLNFDDWKIIMFTRDKQYGFLQYSSEGDDNKRYTDQEKIFFDRSRQNSYLNLLLEEKKIIFYSYTNKNTLKYKPISENAITELYFPLFSNNDSDEEIIGCFYLSLNNHLENDVTKLLSDEYVSAQIINIQRIVNIFYIEYIEDRDFFNLVHILKEIIKTREPLLVSHPFNVAYLCNLIGLELGFTPDQLHRLYMAATLHDIGKVYIPESILSKEGPLTESEMDEMRRHPIHSYNIVKILACMNKNLSGIEEIVLQHHERYDGTGYPNGVKGEDILLESRILAIADSVDAMLSERSYKKPKTISSVINDLIANKNKQFDPILAQITVNILTKNREKHDVILNEPVTIGTIELLTKNKSCQLQGTLIKTNLGHRFKIDCNECLCKKCLAHLSDLVAVTFFTENNGKLNEYSATVKYKDRYQIYISRLTHKPTYDYFSLLWELNGVIAYKDSILSEAIISRIGGDFLCFYINEDQFRDINILKKTNTITINFEDGGTIRVTGKIRKIVKVNYKFHCEFKYLNILESTRDKIFKYIFSKQARLRTGLLSKRTNITGYTLKET